MELPEINQRLESLVFKHCHGNVSKFAEMCGLESVQKLSRLFRIDKRTNNYPEPSLDIIVKIANTFAIDLNWIVYGKEDALNEEAAVYEKNIKDADYLTLSKRMDLVIDQNKEILDKMNRWIAKEMLETEKQRLGKIIENKE